MHFYKKHISQFLLFAFLIFISVIVAVARDWFDESPVNNKKDILKFSHSLHIEQGTDCETCHAGVSESENNLSRHLPTHTECQTCHEEEVSSTCGFCHVDGDNPISFPKRDSKLIFNHKLHLNNQKLGCIECHSGLEKTDFATANNFSKMSQCSTCHNNKTANSNCETCHTDLSSLRPKTHSFASFKREHGTLINSKNENLCASCHSENDCAKCHDGSQISIISPFEKKGMLSPSSSGNNNSKILSGEFVHDINFRFSHGIEAKGKSLKCQTCHREQQFCNDCHQNGSIALGGVIPTSHEQSGFTTLGVNSGGGLHAKLAKRDIESCASCHDADGADPNCIMCHSDTDGILKTNPKTHKDKFFSSIDCDNWRQDENATCYTCHNDANARPNGISGVGFCGYCHGKK
ncbi:MAG: cytochrome c3 family protein [Bacteroidota bacterium]